MFIKDHPKGLFISFVANMGERFSYCIMLSLFVLFFQAKYGMSAGRSSFIFGVFLFCVYFFPLLGGFIADRYIGYGRTISIGLIVVLFGYLLLAIPTKIDSGIGVVIAALVMIALGIGLFKGNLQVLVGNLYDDPKYGALRDRAFNIFYMGINLGAMFAPLVSEKISNWFLAIAHYSYDARIPAMAHGFLNGNLSDVGPYLEIAQRQNPMVTIDMLRAFSISYLDALCKSYHYGFGVAGISLILSVIVFLGLRKHFGSADLTERQKAKSRQGKDQAVEFTHQETKERLNALGLIFIVVIFFWMAAQQGSVSMTYFARDYTVSRVNSITNIAVDLPVLLSLFMASIGLYFLLKKKSGRLGRIAGGAMLLIFGFLGFMRFRSFGSDNLFAPQRFQFFNPFFIVVLTPVMVALFGYLNKKGKEPSAPRKIAYGLLITVAAFLVLILASIGLPNPKQLGGLVAPEGCLVSVHWLISAYFLITIGELFLSPMGISFVTKVAPPKYKGLMQGCWFASVAIGGYLVSIIGFLWMKIPLWSVWLILAGACLLSATFMFLVMNRLEAISRSALSAQRK